MTHYTAHRLTDSMLKAMAAMHNRQRHRYGTMLDALERRSPGEPLIRKRTPRCPECGSDKQAKIEQNRDYNRPGDLITCVNRHMARRDEWGGCYGFTHELTEKGRQALAQARKEGW